MQGWTRSERRWIVFLFVLIAATVFVTLIAPEKLPGAPLTHEEALAKINEWGPDVTADKIVVLDTILQADPSNALLQIALPRMVLAQQGGWLYVGWDPAALALKVPNPDPSKKAPIDWKVTLPQSKIEAPSVSKWPALIAIVSGALVAVVVDESSTAGPFAKQAIAVGAGSAAGVGLFFVLGWLMQPQGAGP